MPAQSFEREKNFAALQVIWKTQVLKWLVQRPAVREHNFLFVAWLNSQCPGKTRTHCGSNIAISYMLRSVEIRPRQNTATFLSHCFALRRHNWSFWGPLRNSFLCFCVRHECCKTRGKSSQHSRNMPASICRWIYHRFAGAKSMTIKMMTYFRRYSYHSCRAIDTQQQ